MKIKDWVFCKIFNATQNLNFRWKLINLFKFSPVCRNCRSEINTKEKMDKWLHSNYLCWDCWSKALDELPSFACLLGKIPWGKRGAT